MIAPGRLKAMQRQPEAGLEPGENLEQCAGCAGHRPALYTAPGCAFSRGIGREPCRERATRWRPTPRAHAMEERREEDGAGPRMLRTAKREIDDPGFQAGDHIRGKPQPSVAATTTRCRSAEISSPPRGPPMPGSAASSVSTSGRRSRTISPPREPSHGRCRRAQYHSVQRLLAKRASRKEGHRVRRESDRDAGIS